LTTSVVIVTRSAATVAAGAEAAGTAAVAAAGAARPGTGTPPTAAGVAPEAAPTAAGLIACAGGLKNDGCPLCLFQASQIRNKDIEKMTHNKVRRISVMGGRNAKREEGAMSRQPADGARQTGAADVAAPDRDRRDTKDGNGRSGRRRGTFPAAAPWRSSASRV
jgi:hypothetical protein